MGRVTWNRRSGPMHDGRHITVRNRADDLPKVPKQVIPCYALFTNVEVERGGSRNLSELAS